MKKYSDLRTRTMCMIDDQILSIETYKDLRESFMEICESLIEAHDENIITNKDFDVLRDRALKKYSEVVVLAYKQKK